MALRSSVFIGPVARSGLLLAALLTGVSCQSADSAGGDRGSPAAPDRSRQRERRPAVREPAETASSGARPTAVAGGAAEPLDTTDRELDDLLGSLDSQPGGTTAAIDPESDPDPQTPGPESDAAADTDRQAEVLEAESPEAESPEAERESRQVAAVPASRGEATPGPPAARRGDDMTRRDYGSDCFSSGCHASLREYPAVHGPVAALSCDACHVAGDDAALHEFRPARPNETMCTFCHTVPRVAKVIHQPFAESRCLDCHDPHGGATREILRVASSGPLCAKCHEPFKGEVLHEPVRSGECSLCHVSHYSDEPHLLARAGKELCGSSGCHEKVEALIAASPHVHGPVSVDCGSCHLAHGGGRPFMLRETTRVLCLGCHDTVATKLEADALVHGPLETENGCAECHTPHASQTAMQLRALPGELCLGCHDREIYSPERERRIANVALEIRSFRYKHGPVATGECEGCHFSHSSMHPGLLVEPYAPSFYQEFSESEYVLCFRCHERNLALLERTTTATKFRDGDRNLHYLHVNKKKGRTCAVCHAIHASDDPQLLRESVPFGSVGWRLPIGHRETPTGGACAPGCHREVSYDNGGAVESVEAPVE